jgi:hypothetical protein
MTRGHVEWPAFEWMHGDCFPDLIQLACLLPQKEDSLRNRTTKVTMCTLQSCSCFYFVFMMRVVFFQLLLIYILLMQFLLALSEHFGDSYLTHIMLPVFLVAVGDDADLTFFPSTIQSRIKGTGS